MKKFVFLAAVIMSTATMMGQSTHIAEGLASIAAVAGETKSVEDSVANDANKVQTAPEKPLWKQKLYYGYNFDIYYHHDSRLSKKENGWSISITPEIGWKINDRTNIGIRIGGSYEDTRTEISVESVTGGSPTVQNLRVRQGSWEVTPYGRYLLKRVINNKIGIWLEGHLYTSMKYPSVAEGATAGTDYDGLRYTINYGAQVSPVITYQFNEKSTFQLFFSIVSFGYSGSAYCYTDPTTGKQYNEYTNDIIIFSGKLKNLLSNQFTPGLYGIKFGVQKSF